MKAKLLAATAAVLLLAAPAIAQDSGGTGGTGGASSNPGTGDSNTTQLPEPGTANSAQGNDTTTNTNAQPDTTNSVQTDQNTTTGTNPDPSAATTNSSNSSTATTASQTPGTADNQQMIQQMSQVTAASDFVMHAAMSDMFEMQSGEFGSSNLKGKMAKELADMIVKDHTKASRELMDLAKTANITVQPPTQLDQRHQALLDELKAAGEEPGSTTSSTSSTSNNTAGDGVVSTTGAMTVDQIFARQQVQAHEEGVALFRSYSQNGDNPELKAFAAKGLPVLEQHLKMAEDLVKAQDELMQKSQQ